MMPLASSASVHTIGQKKTPTTHVKRLSSWKKINCSNTGDGTCCSLVYNHVVIIGSNESFKTFYLERKSNSILGLTVYILKINIKARY